MRLLEDDSSDPLMSSRGNEVKIDINMRWAISQIRNDEIMTIRTVVVGQIGR